MGVSIKPPPKKYYQKRIALREMTFNSALQTSVASDSSNRIETAPASIQRPL